MSKPVSKKARVDAGIEAMRKQVRGPDEVLRHVKRLVDELRSKPQAERTLADLALPHTVR